MNSSILALGLFGTIGIPELIILLIFLGGPILFGVFLYQIIRKATTPKEGQALRHNVPASPATVGPDSPSGSPSTDIFTSYPEAVSYCYSCGRHLNNNEQFCPRCGSKRADK